jgi:hypothetical protein
MEPINLKELKGVYEKATKGEWEWEDGYDIGEHHVGPTVYAGRSDTTHGANLFGRLNVDANGENNLNSVCGLHNAFPKLAEALEIAMEALNDWEAAEHHADLTEFIVRDNSDFAGVGIRAKLQESRRALSRISALVEVK